MPKNRTLEEVLPLYDETQAAWQALSDAQTAIRRKIYPKVPPKDRRYNARTCAAAYFPERPDSKLLVCFFGYTTHKGKICDSWHQKWFSGPEGVDIWKEFHGDEPFPERNEEALAWIEMWKLNVGYTEKNDKLIREYEVLRCRANTLRSRSDVLIRAVRRCVFQYLEVSGYRQYSTEGAESYRFVLSDGRILSSNGSMFIMSDSCQTLHVPAGLPQPPVDIYSAEGSNFSLKRKRNELSKSR